MPVTPCGSRTSARNACADSPCSPIKLAQAWAAAGDDRDASHEYSFLSPILLSFRTHGRAVTDQHSEHLDLPPSARRSGTTVTRPDADTVVAVRTRDSLRADAGLRSTHRGEAVAVVQLSEKRQNGAWSAVGVQPPLDPARGLRVHLLI